MIQDSRHEGPTPDDRVFGKRRVRDDQPVPEVAGAGLHIAFPYTGQPATVSGTSDSARSPTFYPPALRTKAPLPSRLT